MSYKTTVSNLHTDLSSDHPDPLQEVHIISPLRIVSRPYEKIMVMKTGSVVEFGPPLKLLQYKIVMIHSLDKSSRNLEPESTRTPHLRKRKPFNRPNVTTHIVVRS